MFTTNSLPSIEELQALGFDAATIANLQAGLPVPGLAQRVWFLAARHGDLPAAQTVYLSIQCQHGLNSCEEKAGQDEGWGLTALGLAAQGGHLTLLQWLLEQGAWPYCGGENSQTPLQLAIAAGQSEVAQWLIEHGADLHQLDQNGIGPLHAAAQVGDLAIAKLLIERGASPSGSTPYGIVPAWSPTLLAIRHGHLPIVQLLVAYGVAIPEETPDGQSIIQLALKSGNAELVSWLHSRF